MKRAFLILLAFLLLPIFAGCDNSNSAQDEAQEKTLTVTEAELINLQAIAVSMEFPEGGDHTLADGKDSQWNPVLEILSFDETAKTYTAKVDPRLVYGFYNFIVTEEELTSMQAWENENEKKILYPLANKVDFFDLDTADSWYKVNKSGMPIDENGIEIPYAEDMRLVPNYDYDKDGNLRYYLEYPGNTYKIRVCIFTYFEFRFGRELTFPLNQEEEMFLFKK